MGIVKTKGDSSQILEENNDNATCKRSRDLTAICRFQPFKCAAHSPGLSHTTTRYFPPKCWSDHGVLQREERPASQFLM